MHVKTRVFATLAGSALVLTAAAGPAMATAAGPGSMIMTAAAHPSAAGQAQPNGSYMLDSVLALGGEWMHDDGVSPTANQQPV